MREFLTFKSGKFYFSEQYDSTQIDSLLTKSHRAERNNSGFAYSSRDSITDSAGHHVQLYRRDRRNRGEPNTK